MEIVYEVAQSQNQDEDQSEDVGVNSHVLWDRKVDGGFPETKVCFLPSFPSTFSFSVLPTPLWGKYTRRKGGVYETCRRGPSSLCLFFSTPHPSRAFFPMSQSRKERAPYQIQPSHNSQELKRRVRDVIEPGRNLGHVDQNYGQSKGKKDERDRAEAPGEGEASRAVGTTKETTTHAIKVAESHGGKNCSAEAGKCEDCE